MRLSLGRFRCFPLLLALLSAYPAMAQDPGASSWLKLAAGAISGQSLSPTNRTINVPAGGSIKGWFTVEVNSTWPTNTTMWMGVTPTWGDARYSYIDAGGWSGPYTGLSPAIGVDLTAPSTPGTYYLIAAYHAEFNAAQVLSATNWSVIEPVWHNGDDIAAWSPTTIAEANTNGTVLVDFLYPSGNSPRYVPATAIIVNVGPAAPTDPGGTSSLLLVNGTISGQTVSAVNHAISVNPGASITGQFTVQVNSTFPTGSTMSMGVTPTWGDHATGYTDLGGFTTPIIGMGKTVDVNLTAPTTPGTYYIVVAFRDESSAVYVMSGTTAASGAPVWNNGDDVADWSPAAINAANTFGTTFVNYSDSGANRPRYVPATAIVVAVGVSTTDPGASSSMLLVDGTIAGHYVTPVNRTLTVMPGALLTGELHVQVNSTFPAGSPMALGVTSTWGVPQISYTDLGSLPTPVAGLSKTIPIYMEAPTQPGIYYIISAFYGDYEAGQVMSATHSSVGANVWHNGDDIAAWTPATIDMANAYGTVLVNYLFPWGNNPRSVPATAIKIVVSTSDPANRSLVKVMGGTLAGQTITETNTTIMVAPGAAISGQFNVKVNSAWPSGSHLTMGVTPSWGDHASGFTQLDSGFATPANWTRDITVNYKAPNKPGVYYIITAFRDQASAAEVMSCTNASPGADVWNNGDDVADWTPVSVDRTNEFGNVYVDYLGLPGNSPRHVPAGAITVIVQSTEWHADFNGDGKADVLWYNSKNGSVYVFLMNGAVITSGGSPGQVRDLDWQIQGVADFNGDGKADILWRHRLTGMLYVWLMNGTEATATSSLGLVADRKWSIERIADFNGDKKADLLWRHASTGMLYVWLMDGTRTISMGSPGGVEDQTWQIQDTGDFNGDGKADLLWRNSVSGMIYVWLMNGTNVTSMGCPGTVSDLDWQIRALGDFNGDGKTDLFWVHQTTGQAYVWLMSGIGLAANGSPGRMAETDWKVIGSADFNADGKADILWRHATSGQLAVWLMQDIFTSAKAFPGTVGDLNWQIVGLADFDGNRKADIIWRHYSTGEVALWLMNGTQNVGQGSVAVVDDKTWVIVK